MAANQTPTTLPTREQFLATGLTTVDTSSPDSPTECGICIDPFTDPVTLGCHSKHIFCRDCITTWLSSANSCPLCKTKLFVVPIPIPPRTQLVYAANNILRERSTIWDIQPFGAGPFQQTPADTQRLVDSNSTAFWWLNEGHFAPGRVFIQNGIYVTTGTGFIETATLAANYAMMGNYIPAIAEARGRVYTAQQREHWTLVLTTLWGVIQQYDGRATDTSPYNLLKKLRKKLKKLPHFASIQSLRRNPEEIDDAFLHFDLVCLLDFVAVLTQNEERRQCQLDAEARKRLMAKLKSVKRLFTPVRDFGRWLVSDL